MLRFQGGEPLGAFGLDFFRRRQSLLGPELKHFGLGFQHGIGRAGHFGEFSIYRAGSRGCVRARPKRQGVPHGRDPVWRPGGLKLPDQVPQGALVPRSTAHICVFLPVQDKVVVARCGAFFVQGAGQAGLAGILADVVIESQQLGNPLQFLQLALVGHVAPLHIRTSRIEETACHRHLPEAPRSQMRMERSGDAFSTLTPR